MVTRDEVLRALRELMQGGRSVSVLRAKDLEQCGYWDIPELAKALARELNAPKSKGSETP